jgi:hypothetical protein
VLSGLALLADMTCWVAGLVGWLGFLAWLSGLAAWLVWVGRAARVGWVYWAGLVWAMMGWHELVRQGWAG